MDDVMCEGRGKVFMRQAGENPCGSHPLWRAGEVRDYEGSSEDSPRYLVRDEKSLNVCITDACDMRKRGPA